MIEDRSDARQTAVAPPLILTLTLDEAARDWFDRLRTEHFPPERLLVGAHVTMFHALPGERLAEIVAAAASASARPGFAVAVGAPRSLGRGVAFGLVSPEAEAIRAALASRFAGALTPQDRAPWSPHVTIQNKVTPERARETLARVRALSVPHVSATGLALWEYHGGPWRAIEDHDFASAAG